MQPQNTISTRKIVITALLAALTAAGSAIRITLPIDIAGTTSFHLGNIMCALAGLLLGPWFGALASGIGSFLYDLLSGYYFDESIITFLTKGAYGLGAGLVFWQLLRGDLRPTHAKGALASAVGAVSYGALYLLKSYLKGIWVNGLTHDAAMLTLAGKLPATIFNGVVAVIFAPILYLAIQKALKRSHLSF